MLPFIDLQSQFKLIQSQVEERVIVFYEADSIYLGLRYLNLRIN